MFRVDAGASRRSPRPMVGTTALTVLLVLVLLGAPTWHGCLIVRTFTIVAGGVGPAPAYADDARSRESELERQQEDLKQLAERQRELQKQLAEQQREQQKTQLERQQQEQKQQAERQREEQKRQLEQQQEEQKRQAERQREEQARQTVDSATKANSQSGFGFGSEDDKPDRWEDGEDQGNSDHGGEGNNGDESTTTNLRDADPRSAKGGKKRAGPGKAPPVDIGANRAAKFKPREIMATNLGRAAQGRARALGFRLISHTDLANLNMKVERFIIPEGMDVASASKLLKAELRSGQFSPNNVYRI